MKKIIVFGALFVCASVFASGTDEKVKKTSEVSSNTDTIDECCNKTIEISVFVEEWYVVFSASGTASACITSETRDDPRNMEIACGLATRAATTYATREVERMIEEYPR
ncbi:hypothetical protein OGH69_03985 [Flavobacterium sp. MFBS3-15]|uniref:hypothetical protein n=1 Tax=Flavobacterium sp. MFBS3-15 TaxID=2989816 RepID=UPI0022362321|nr:hypothetical protein [Flavobacterium sp. MFBS3-15]MCW4468115.1 hypothetical protein [Flavobacterium sp. MFBS3-15]